MKEGFLNFSSNDYLNLAQDERVKRAAANATMRLGASAGASRLMTGHLEIHAELETALANYLQQESALVFGSGFLTNLGVLTALADRHDVIFSDRLNHASLIDGALQSRAKVVRYRHNDMAELEQMLQSTTGPGQKIIVTESVFSMDGDRAPIRELAELSDRFGALLMIDEAHAVGVFGRGLVSDLNRIPKRLVVVGTLSKALASYGGFVACSRELREYFVNCSRTFIYSTALPPGSCAAAIEALKIIGTEPNLGDAVLEKAKLLHQLLNGVNAELLPFESQIVPVIVKSNERAIRLCETLFSRGIICKAVRPPTVPENTSRLRLSVTAAHTDLDIRRVAREILELCSD
jgi:8-amino-7-oxononanoate synthase